MNTYKSNIVRRYLRQDSSSDLSAQSGSLSHTHCFGIHVPEPHLNCVSKHASVRQNVKIKTII